MITLNFIDLAANLSSGLELLKSEFDLAIDSSGFPVNSQRGSGLSIYKNAAHALITYSEPVEFFRGVALLLLNFETTEISLDEPSAFKSNGIMLDCSRNAVLKVESIERILRKMSMMGLNLAMVYTEDTYEVEGLPYLGYCRGRYTKDELKRLDDYAYLLGIEIIPCIQTLSHLERVLQWPVMAPYRDTLNTLLVDSDETYELIEKLIAAASAPFRTNRIHIGMDEAVDMGDGNYKVLNGYSRRNELMEIHLRHVRTIIAKLGLKAMMWSDMHLLAVSGQPLLDGYYPMDIDTIPDEIIKTAPGDIDLVFWNYYHRDEKVYDHMLSLHNQFDGETIFAGGIWTWTGPTADYDMTLETTIPALTQCRKHGVKEVFATSWGDDGGETNLMTILYGLQLYAEMDYTGSFDRPEMERRFLFIAGSRGEYFEKLKMFHLLPGVAGTYLGKNPSKIILFEDPLLNLFEEDFKGMDLGPHYEELKSLYTEAASEDSPFTSLWNFYRQYAEVLLLKCQWRSSAADRVRKRDRSGADELLVLADRNIEAIEELGIIWQELWFSTNKPYGFEIIDQRIGGLIARFKSAKKRMGQFARGEIETIEELETPKLPYAKSASGEFSSLTKWKKIISPSGI